jgi:hypothetical protein
MKVLIISDVHANLWALRAVVHDAGPVDYVLCAGDIVSYGPDPRATLDSLRAQAVIAVRGNHDHAVATRADPQASPAKQPLALAMRDWTRSQLEPADITWLTRLPLRLTHEAVELRAEHIAFPADRAAGQRKDRRRAILPLVPRATGRNEQRGRNKRRQHRAGAGLLASRPRQAIHALHRNAPLPAVESSAVGRQDVGWPALSA